MSKKIELQLKITEAHLQFHKNEETFLELVKNLIDQQTQIIIKNLNEKNLNQILNNFNNTMGFLERNQIMYNKSHDRFLKMNLNIDEDDNDLYPQKLLGKGFGESNDEGSTNRNKELLTEKKINNSKNLDKDINSSTYIKYDDEKKKSDSKIESKVYDKKLNTIKDTIIRDIPIKDTNIDEETKKFNIDVLKKLQVKVEEKNNISNVEIAMKNDTDKLIKEYKNDSDIKFSNDSINEDYIEVEEKLESTFNRDEVISVIIGIIEEMTGYPESIISEEMELKADLGFDSIKIIELLSLMEKKSIDINQKDLTMMGIEINTITDIAEAVTSISKKKLNM